MSYKSKAEEIYFQHYEELSCLGMDDEEIEEMAKIHTLITLKFIIQSLSPNIIHPEDIQENWFKIKKEVQKL